MNGLNIFFLSFFLFFFFYVRSIPRFLSVGNRHSINIVGFESEKNLIIELFVVRFRNN